MMRCAKSVGGQGFRQGLLWKPLAGAVLALYVGVACALPAAERTRVERLLAKIESASGAVFIRNGSEYSAANAAEFLRRKCARRLGTLSSAEEFVRECASRSSTTGEAYRIKLPGEALPRASAEILERWLAGTGP